MSINNTIKEKPKTVFNKNNLQNFGAFVVLGGLAAISVEEYVSGGKAKEICAAMSPELARIAESFKTSAALAGDKKITLTIGRELTDKDVDLIFPWSRHKTCRFEITAP